MRRDVARHRLALLPIYIDNRIAFMRWRTSTAAHQLRLATEDRRDGFAFWVAKPRPRVLAPAITLALTSAVLAALLIVPHAGRSAPPRVRPAPRGAGVMQRVDVYARLQRTSPPRVQRKRKAPVRPSVAPQRGSTTAQPVAPPARVSVVEHARTKPKASAKAPRPTSPRVSKPATPRPTGPRTAPPPHGTQPPSHNDSHSRDGEHGGTGDS
jgi:hypothetical protein